MIMLILIHIQLSLCRAKFSSRNNSSSSLLGMTEKQDQQKNPRLSGKGGGREAVSCSQDYLSSILLNWVDKTSTTHPGDSWNCCQGFGIQAATGSRIISIHVSAGGTKQHLRGHRFGFCILNPWK